MLSFSRDPHRQDPVHSKHSFEWENYWWQSCKMKFKRSKPPMARKLFCAGKSNDFPNQEVTRTWSVKWYDCFVSVMVLLSPCPDLNFRWHELSPANSSLSMLSCAGHEMLVRQCCPLGSGCLCLRTASSMRKTNFLSSSSLRLCPDLDTCLLCELGRTLVVFICKYSLPSLEALWYDSLSHSVLYFKLLSGFKRL